MTLKKLFLASSLVITTVFSIYYIAQSCGYHEDECDTFAGFINPNSTSVKNASPFYFTPSYLFYSCDEDSNNISTSNGIDERNYVEWSLYMKDKVKPNYIQGFMNNYSADTLLRFYNNLAKGERNKLPQTLLQNPVASWFQATRDFEALGYMIHAKKCEESLFSEDEWTVKRIDTAIASRLIKNGIQLYKAAKHETIKRRYALQLIRTAFYASKYDELQKLYNNYYEPVASNTSVDERILGYRAGALYKTKQAAESAYCYSKLFDVSYTYDDAYSNTLSFVWANASADSSAILSFCKNKHEQATVNALRALRNTVPYNKHTIESVYSLEPTHKLLEVILLRELNKIEMDYLEPKFQHERGFFIYDKWVGGINQSVDSASDAEWHIKRVVAESNLRDFKSFLDNVIREKKIENMSMWLMASAYLQYAMDEHESALAKLNKAKNSKNTDKLNAQIRLLELVSTIGKQKKLTPAFEQQVYDDISFLEKFSRANKTYMRNLSNVLFTVLPTKYAEMGDTLKATLCYHKYENIPLHDYEIEYPQPKPQHFSEQYHSISGGLIDKYFNEKQLDQFLAFKKNPKSDMDKWLLKESKYTDDILREVKAYSYFRNFEFEKARQILSENQALLVLPNPFVAHIRDYQDDYYADSIHQITNLELLDSLIVLRKKMYSNMQAAFDYACALYSLSYHGRGHQAWTYYRDYTDLTPYYYDVAAQYTPFEKQYYFIEDGAKLFDLVYQSSKDHKLKQKALWMLAKCNQKKHNGVLLDYFYWEKEKSMQYVKSQTEQNKFLQVFHEQYKGTDYYKEVYDECSYLRMYAN